MRRILTSIVLVMVLAGCDSENTSDGEKPSEAENSSGAPMASGAPVSSEVKKTLNVQKTFQEGTAAAELGDYRTALEIWRPLAEQGVVPAQINLGNLYLQGHGVLPDDVEAAKWFRRAADQGEPKAQNNLGVMYANGKGVPQDWVQAYVWFSLGASQPLTAGQPQVINDSAKNRDRAASQMTPEQIVEAKKLAAELKAK